MLWFQEKRSDDTVLDEIFAALYPQALATARLIVKDRHLAEDAVQDAFMYAYRRKEILTGLPDPKPWLLKMVSCRARDLFRNLEHQPKPVDEEFLTDMIERAPAIGETPQDYAEQAELKEKASEWLDALNEDQRQAVVLAYYGGLKDTEIAQQLGLPIGTVKSRLRRGRLILADIVSSGPYVAEGGSEDE